MTLFGKTPEHRQGAGEGAEKVGIQGALVLFQRNVPGVTGAHDGRIFDENIELAELLEGRIDRMLPLYGRTDIQLDGAGFFTQRGCQGVRAFCIDICQHHVVTQ